MGNSMEKLLRVISDNKYSPNEGKTDPEPKRPTTAHQQCHKWKPLSIQQAAQTSQSHCISLVSTSQQHG